MANRILNNIAMAFLSCMVYFERILEATGMKAVWFSAILVVLSYKFILSPIFGMAHSDTVKKSYNAFRRKKED